MCQRHERFTQRECSPPEPPVAKPPRADGGVNRSDRGAKVFANMKTVIRTCHKQGINFFDYARQVMRSTLTGLPPPLPLATADA